MVVHYKSRWNSELERSGFITGTLRGLRLSKPDFVSVDARFFPDQCLSAACAHWAVLSARSFLAAFHEHLGFPDRSAVMRNG